MILKDKDGIRPWLQRVRLEDGYGMDVETEFWGMYVAIGGFLRLIGSRFLFAIEGGRVGISTLAVREGDEVAMLPGEQLPYLVRKCPGQPGRHTLVCPCWISGFVNGETWPSRSGNGLWEDLEWIELV
ncbi:hypothetical protein GGR53DRAFT_491518 [Hypoxylon sp. FL1150]|nr:hypothetical protein GGR53DRAFT_491518 [Hypoxylon sp. FL1150]